MLRHVVRTAALGLVATGLSVGLTSTGSSAAPDSLPPAAIACSAVHSDAATAEAGLAKARTKVTNARAKVVLAKRILKQAKRKVDANPTPAARRKLAAAKSAKLRASGKLAVAVKTKDKAKRAADKAATKLRNCRAAQPTITGPVTGGEHGYPGTATALDLAAHDYVETEYFLSGTATSYERKGAWKSDGAWGVTPKDTAAYQTRMLVRAPEDAAAFNGTVLVEWLNVSGNSDADVDFPYMYSELIRQGYAWVGVSAQSVGVNSTGGASTVGATVMGLKNWDPTRYGSLVHPGDAYSYDIFSQAGRALLSTKGADPLPGMKVKQLIAAGQSQSGFRMITYVNAIQKLAKVYDGLIVHSRSGMASPLGTGIFNAPQGTEGPDSPSPVRVRTDLDVPVMQLASETELFETGNDGPDTVFSAARQPDTDLIRTWEMAGTAHSDVHLVKFMNAMYQRQFEGARDLSPVYSMINDGPQNYISSAALRAMRTWIINGEAPTSVAPIEIADGKIVRDANGNAIGGVRTPQVDVPVATLSGDKKFVPLNGFTTRFDAAQLHTMYGSHANYVSLFKAAASSAVAKGFLLPEDAATLIAEAEASTIGD